METDDIANNRFNGGVATAHKLTLLAIGGGIGVAAALLFAPKQGRELRRDLAGLIDKGYDRVLVTVSEMKDVFAY